MNSKFRLLVVRLGAMGDILHALPAVTALRQAHPQWIIDWVIDPRWLPLLSANDDPLQPIQLQAGSAIPTASQPIVDRLHTAPTRAWRKAPFAQKTRHEISNLRHSLRIAQYDAVLDLQGAIRSAMIGRMAGCPRFIGEAHPREALARWLFTECVATHGAHVIEQDLELASAVARDTLEPAAPWLPVDSQAEAWADQICPPASHPAVLINPGAGWGAKCWPIGSYSIVAQQLITKGLRAFVNVGPGEERLGALIRHETAGAATPLVCTLSQLIAITRRVDLVIAGDTGPLHLACALRRPVVGIYGPTDPRRNGPYGTKFKVLRSPDSRRDHTRHAAPEAGLLTIKPEDVLQAAHELLTEESRP